MAKANVVAECTCPRCKALLQLDSKANVVRSFAPDSKKNEGEETSKKPKKSGFFSWDDEDDEVEDE